MWLKLAMQFKVLVRQLGHDSATLGGTIAPPKVVICKYLHAYKHFYRRKKIHIWCAPVYFMLSPRRIGLMHGDDWKSVYLHFMMGTLEYKWDSLPWFDLNVTISTCLASLAPFKLPSGTASYTYLHKQKKRNPENPKIQQTYPNNFLKTKMMSN